jgi:cardiolipin synthase A/B
MVEGAHKEIKIIQPYHYPMIRFDRAMGKAVDRGVTANILTSGQRDQPVFRNIFNYMLFQRLILRGINVFETKERLLHSKVYLADGRLINMGSMNNDRWSWKVTKNYTISASRAASIAFWQNFLYLSEILMSKQGLPEEAYVKSNTEIPPN